MEGTEVILLQGFTFTCFTSTLCPSERVSHDISHVVALRLFVEAKSQPGTLASTALLCLPDASLFKMWLASS